jgi:Flp pilus assembly protein CpaB
MLRSIGRRLPRLGPLPRLLLAGSCLLLAALTAVDSRRVVAAAPSAARVVVARRPMPAGHVLAARDLRVVRWPRTVRPSEARGDPSSLVGHRLAGPVGAGEPITATRLMGADLARGLGSGLVATPVPLADAHAADLVRAGDRVDLLETARPPDVLDISAPARPRVRTVATGARVVAVLPESDAAAPELVIAVDRETAVRITRDTATQVFTAVVAPP